MIVIDQRLGIVECTVNGLGAWADTWSELRQPFALLVLRSGSFATTNYNGSGVYLETAECSRVGERDTHTKEVTP